MELEVKQRSAQTIIIRTLASIGIVSSLVFFINDISKDVESANPPSKPANNQYLDALPSIENNQSEIDQRKMLTVIGTGNKGLNLRQKPGTDAKIINYAWDGEIFFTTGQSIVKDNYLWYQIEDENDNIYWAASDYLK